MRVDFVFINETVLVSIPTFQIFMELFSKFLSTSFDNLNVAAVEFDSYCTFEYRNWKHLKKVELRNVEFMLKSVMDSSSKNWKDGRRSIRRQPTSVCLRVRCL